MGLTMRHANGTMARLAMELMLNIAARRHDAHVIGRQHLRKGCLSWRPSKTSQSTGKVLTIRVLPGSSDEKANVFAQEAAE